MQCSSVFLLPLALSMRSIASAARRFVAEMKRRRVFRVAAVYAVAGWVMIRVVDVVAPNLGWPGWVVSAVIVLVSLGFVLALVLAWVFDIEAGRVQRTGSPPAAVANAEGAAASGGVPAHAAATHPVERPTGFAGAQVAAEPAAVRADRVEPAGAIAEPPVRSTSAEPVPRSIAVLPFANLSADPENEYFADGITEDVIAQLSKIGELRVTSRASVMLFKRGEQSLREIGAALGAATLLAGSVRRAGDRVRIVMQLVDAETDRYLWAETYDRRLTDVFAIQTDVAFQIAAALEAKLSIDERTRIGKEPTSSLEAYQLYLKGRHCYLRYTAEGIQQGIAYFERAIALDPGYALAHAGVAMAYAELAETGALDPDRAYQRAREAAAAALALDAGLAEAHCMIGQLRVVRDFDWAGAERAFQRALELSPSSADTYDLYGRMCSALGRYDEAVAMEERAQQLDPLAHRSDLATALLRAGRFDEALEVAARAVEFDPTYDRARATLGWAYLKKGMHAEGVAELEQAVSLSPGNTAWLSQLGQAYALAGRVEEAREMLRRLEELARERYVSPYHFAYVYTGLGEDDRAIDYLERAYEERAGAVYGIRGSFLFTSLHSHPRFAARLARMNLA